jgi:SAM-dependent methyltransferase
MNPFATIEMALGYARARPPVHALVMELVRRECDLAWPVERALDVGCGSGLSTRALDGLALKRMGLEPVLAMARLATAVAPGARFACGAAETLPFRAESVDLLVAAGALNYVRLEPFFNEARRVLRGNGHLLVYDFGPGCKLRDGNWLEQWFAAFVKRYPFVVGEARELSVDALREFASGMRMVSGRPFVVELAMERTAYLEYMLTEANVAAAERRGVERKQVWDWCEETLPREGWPCGVLFEGYYAVLQSMQTGRPS